MALFKVNPKDIVADVNNGHDSSSDSFEFFPAISPPPLPARNKLSSNSASTWNSSNRQSTKYQKLKNRALGSDPKRPKWSLMILGPVRVPDMEMEIKEMRTRQRRQSETEKRVEVDRWGPWKFVQSLTCKGMDVVLVA